MNRSRSNSTPSPSTPHARRAARDRDRGRDIALQLAGYRVLRITHRRLADRRAAVIDVLRALLTPAT